MLNIEKYKEDILKMLEKEYSCGAMEMIYKFAEHKTSKPFKSYYDLFNWLCEEYKEPLLTKDECNEIGGCSCFIGDERETEEGEN